MQPLKRWMSSMSCKWDAVVTCLLHTKYFVSKERLHDLDSPQIISRANYSFNKITNTSTTTNFNAEASMRNILLTRHLSQRKRWEKLYTTWFTIFYQLQKHNKRICRRRITPRKINNCINKIIASHNSFLAVRFLIPRITNLTTTIRLDQGSRIRIIRIFFFKYPRILAYSIFSYVNINKIRYY